MSNESKTLRATTPSSAPPPRPECQSCMQLMEERDHAQDMADRLAYAKFDISAIGEHSNLNCPWTNAAELLEAEAAARAEAAPQSQPPAPPTLRESNKHGLTQAQLDYAHNTAQQIIEYVKLDWNPDGKDPLEVIKADAYLNARDAIERTIAHARLGVRQPLPAPPSPDPQPGEQEEKQ